MDSLAAFWHLAGFVAVPGLLGLVAALVVKLLWRRPLAGLPLTHLAMRAVAASVAAAVAGLVLTGRDGTMLTYGGMVAACALVLWWPLRRG